MTVHAIADPELLVRVWPKVEPWVKEANDRLPGYYLPHDILVAALRNEMMIWVAIEGDEIDMAAITKIVNFPRARILDVLLLAGRDRDAWLHELMAKLEVYARSQSCTRLHGGGRKGWARVTGWEPIGFMIAKDLTQEKADA